MKYSLLFFFGFLIVTMPVSTLAHSAGNSFEIENNGYTIDIGYSSPAPEAGESVIFDFEVKKDGERFRDFSDVWVRVEGVNGTVLATGVYNADFGGARMSYVFPAPGNYTINARYQNGDEVVTEEEDFTLTVIESSASASRGGVFGASTLIGLIIGILLGIIGMFIAQRKKK